MLVTASTATSFEAITGTHTNQNQTSLVKLGVY